MATVTLTFSDTDEQEVEIRAEADPSIPMKDGHPDVDHPDFTAAMAAAISAGLGIARQARTATVATEDTATGEREVVGTVTQVEAKEEIPTGLGDTLLAWSTATGADVAFGRVESGDYILMATFGQEAPDSPMIGGAINSAAATLVECVEQGLAQAGVNPCRVCGWAGDCGEDCHS